MELIGWNSPEQAAEEVWSSIHSSLLSGELLLGYKNNETGDIKQLVIVKNKDNSLGIGLITGGYTELLPSVPKEYITVVFLEELKVQKLNKNILESIKDIINKL